MTDRARRTFDAQDITLACAVALLAQVAFVAAFSMPSPSLVEADISNDNARPIAVAITPVLKLGSKTPSKLPSPWQRKRPAVAKTQSPAPSPLAEKNPDVIPTTKSPDRPLSPNAVDAGKTEPWIGGAEGAGTLATAASTQGNEQGAANGTETDPLKAPAADFYRAELAAFFTSRFDIRGKIPFDTLKALHASALVTVTAERKLGSFSVVTPSGNPTFDEEVRATLSRIQSSGTELPAPPPAYPEMLGGSVPVGFQCNLRRLCE